MLLITDIAIIQMDPHPFRALIMRICYRLLLLGDCMNVCM